MKMPSATEAALLASLGPNRLTGRELASRYKQQIRRSISYGTLYTTMSRLRDLGWVEAEDSEDEDGRLRYFRLTGSGAKALSDFGEFFSPIVALVRGVAI